LKARALDGLSIGFRTLKSVRTKTGRLLQELQLEEISLVTIPALATARVTSVKSHAGRRRVPEKDSPDMSLELSVPDDGAETPAAELPPEILSRIEELETRSAKIDGLTDQLDKVLTKLARPAYRVEVREDTAELERKAFVSFCRKGWDGMSELERKVLTAGGVASPTDSGYQLVPETFLREMQKNLVEVSPMRSVARVTTVGGSPVKLPKRTSNLAAGWVAEVNEHAVSEPAYGQQEVPIFEARVSSEITNAMLEDAAFDMSSELAADFAEEFGRIEGAAFVGGNGTSQPEGFTVSSAFTTTSGGAGLDADDLIDLYHSIPARYAANGTWLMRREMIGSVRKLKITDGPYIWQESLQPGNPPSLLGRPVLEMPDMAADSASPADIVIAFGDWNRAYRIFDRVGLEVLRDPYTEARNSLVVFHARRRVGGALVDGAAVKGLTL